MLRNNQGNVLKVIHETGCSLKVAEESLLKANSWIEAYKYAKNMEAL